MTAALVCAATGHDPITTDPTGGDPFMGGPVSIVVCSRCGHELPSSAPEPGGKRDAGRIASLLILGAALIGLGELIRRGDDNLHDLGD